MNTEKKIADLQTAAIVLCELLANVTMEHLACTLKGARESYKKADEPDGSYWWMQNHYTATAAEVRAAYVISKNIEALVDDLDAETARNAAQKKSDKCG